MMKINQSDRASHNAGVAFFLCVLLFIVVMVLDHTAPRPETNYLLGFSAAAVVVTLAYWWFLTPRVARMSKR